MSWTVKGYSEVLIDTRQARDWVGLLSGPGRWTLHGDGSDSEGRHEWLLGRQGHETGMLRLRETSDTAADARQGLECWDTGNIYDIDIRVRDLHAWVPELLALGWQPVSDPVDWPFGAVKVREWLAIGPDSVVVAFVQRLHPPLESMDGMEGFSHAFNSSQTVRAIGPAMKFYEALGFEVLVEHHAPLDGPGGEVLGLEPVEAPDTHVDLVIMAPHGEMDGSVELVALPGKSGGDYANRRGPGLRRLRFPTSGLYAYHAHLAQQGLAPEAIMESDWLHQGLVHSFRITSPDGAELEFYEPSAAGSGGS